LLCAALVARLLIPTILLGRFFCGWICPLGSLNQFLGSLRSQSRERKTRIVSNRYNSWQTTKYLLLSAGVLVATFGISIVGWIDPFSLFVRSIGVSALPAAKLTTQRLPNYLFRKLAKVTEPVGKPLAILILVNQPIPEAGTYDTQRNAPYILAHKSPGMIHARGFEVRSES
jgi:hypothetical protein